jgi:hypothetical protein
MVDGKDREPPELSSYRRTWLMHSTKRNRAISTGHRRVAARADPGGKMPDFHVAPSGDGDWDVKRAEDGEVLSHHGTREDAEIHARQLAHEAGGGEVRLHDVQGQINQTEAVD